MSNKPKCVAHLRGTLTFAKTETLPNNGPKVRKMTLEVDDGRRSSLIKIAAWGASQQAAEAFKKGDRVQLVGEVRRDDFEKPEGKQNTILEVNLNGDDGVCSIEATAEAEDVNEVHIDDGIVVWASEGDDPFPYKKDGKDVETSQRRFFIGMEVTNSAGEPKTVTVPVTVVGVDAAMTVQAGQSVAIKGVLAPRRYEHEGVNRYDDRVRVWFDDDGFVIAPDKSAEAAA